MAQSALTVTPPNPTPPTNLSTTGATPPNPTNYTKLTYAGMEAESAYQPARCCRASMSRACLAWCSPR